MMMMTMIMMIRVLRSTRKLKSYQKFNWLSLFEFQVPEEKHPLTRDFDPYRQLKPLFLATRDASEHHWPGQDKQGSWPTTTQQTNKHQELSLPRKSKKKKAVDLTLARCGKSHLRLRSRARQLRLNSNRVMCRTVRHRGTFIQ